jgi:uncharacterized membrane protein YfcA
MTLELAASASGLFTGFVVGMTGVGGGALMTPLLILLLGVAPQTAVGTDLLFATVTKLVAVKIHGSHGTVDWQIVRRLASGSIPAACVVLVVLYLYLPAGGAGAFMMPTIGVALLLTAAAMLLKTPLHAVGRRLRIGSPGVFKSLQPALTVAAGVAIGVLVTLTSIGAGALGTVFLVYLYPLRLTPARLVGTDLAHAVPVALIAGLGHLALGNIDFVLLAWLLAGSLPGVWLGSHLSARAPERLLRNLIALVLLGVGARILA